MTFGNDIRHSLEMGIIVETDNPNLHEIVTTLTDAQIGWIAAWLAGEGFTR
jgi:hypothetical protein